MRRGEVWWTSFEHPIGGKIRERRPAIIVSDDLANRLLNRVQVIPITGNVSRSYPGEARVTLQGQPAKALATQLQTAAKERLVDLAGMMSTQDMVAVDRAFKNQLGLT